MELWKRVGAHSIFNVWRKNEWRRLQYKCMWRDGLRTHGLVWILPFPIHTTLPWSHFLCPTQGPLVESQPNDSSSQQPPPSVAAPSSDEEEIHYASLSFHGMKPRDPQEHQSITSEYSEIKTHEWKVANTGSVWSSESTSGDKENSELAGPAEGRTL